MNLQEQKSIKILKRIAKELGDKLHCDRHGSCVHFAELFVDEVNEKYPSLLNDFDVVEGYVNSKAGDGIPQEHTWIRLKNNEVIDPTFLQFTKYDTNSKYSLRKSNVYTGQEYYDEGKEGSWFSERRKEQPNTVFKEEKKELIKRILREESKNTNLQDKVLYILKSKGVELVLKAVGGFKKFSRILNINSPMDYLHLFDDVKFIPLSETEFSNGFFNENNTDCYGYSPDKIIFIHFKDRKGEGRISYEEIWEILREEFELSHKETVELTTEWLNSVFDLQVSNTFDDGY
jgi:hypothetical protein